MKYRSTRGKVEGFSFEDALFSGYTSDGGLLMPETIPHVDTARLEKWKALSYLELCKEVMPLFISQEEIPFDDLSALVDEGFANFGHKDITPVVKVGDFYVLELFYGKTQAFKDISLVTVGLFMDYFLNKRKKSAVVLVASSGDTGSASIEMVRKSKWMDIVCLFPVGRCSKIQELQMTTIMDENVHVLGGPGACDDLDVPLKNCFMDKSYAEDHNLCMMNSINWGRLLATAVHIFYAYLQVCGEVGEAVKYVVPSGALGHTIAAALACVMGLPIQVVVAVNENNMFHRAMSSGDFIPMDRLIYTWSSSMDTALPYNVERIFYLFSDMSCACDVVHSMMEELEQKGAMKIPEDLLENMRKFVSTSSVSREQTLDTMKKYWDEHQYLLCPHTAVGVAAAWDERRVDNMPTICAATASAAKFPEAVKAAGIEMQLPPQLVKLFSSPTRYKEMKKGEDWDKIVRTVIGQIKERRGKIAK